MIRTGVPATSLWRGQPCRKTPTIAAKDTAMQSNRGWSANLTLPDYGRVARQPLRIRLLFSALPRWRPGRGLAGHKLVGHAYQVAQYIGIDARQANQHGAIANVVVRHVVHIGVCSQLSAIIEIHSNGKRVRLGRPISGDTRQEFSMHFERRKPVWCALLRLRVKQVKSDIPYGFEIDCTSQRWSARFRRTH
jgi:hypothetical protein